MFGVGSDIGDRPSGNAGIHCRLGHRWRQRNQQTRIERARDEIVGAKTRRLAAIGIAQIRRFAAREFGDGFDAGEFHRLVDRRCANIERATKNVRETERVVDLIRIIAATGGDDRLRANAARIFRQDFRARIGQRENNRPLDHGRDHRRFQHAAGRKPEENICTVDDIGQRARGSITSVTGNGRIETRAIPIEHAVLVGHQNIFVLHAQRDQHVQTSDARRAGAAGGKFHIGNIFPKHMQGVDYRRTNNDRGAMLVVVEDRDLHALAQLALDLEAFRCLDVFEIDAAESRFQAGDDVNEFVGIVLGDFQIKHVDTGEFLEQHGLAFHHRLSR